MAPFPVCGNGIGAPEPDLQVMFVYAINSLPTQDRPHRSWTSPIPVARTYACSAAGVVAPVWDRATRRR